MSRLRSRLNPRLVLALFVLVLSASLISLASSTGTANATQRPAIGTPAAAGRGADQPRGLDAAARRRPAR